MSDSKVTLLQTDKVLVGFKLLIRIINKCDYNNHNCSVFKIEIVNSKYANHSIIVDNIKKMKTAAVTHILIKITIIIIQGHRTGLECSASSID